MPIVPTITGRCEVICRRVRPMLSDPKIPVTSVRKLHGIELLQLAGWHASMLDLGRCEERSLSHRLLSSLAGNAFSGFACAPFSMIALYVMGAPGGPWPETPAPVTPVAAFCRCDSDVDILSD